MVWLGGEASFNKKTAGEDAVRYGDTSVERDTRVESGSAPTGSRTARTVNELRRRSAINFLQTLRWPATAAAGAAGLPTKNDGGSRP